MYCRPSIDWPFSSICQNLKETYDICESDYECGVDHYCWYASEQDRQFKIKKCVKLYAFQKNETFGWYAKNPDNLELDDFIQNGKACETGLAYPYS